MRHERGSTEEEIHHIYTAPFGHILKYFLTVKAPDPPIRLDLVCFVWSCLLVTKISDQKKYGEVRALHPTYNSKRNLK